MIFASTSLGIAFFFFALLSFITLDCFLFFIFFSFFVLLLIFIFIFSIYYFVQSAMRRAENTTALHALKKFYGKGFFIPSYFLFFSFLSSYYLSFYFRSFSQHNVPIDWRENRRQSNRILSNIIFTSKYQLLSPSLSHTHSFFHSLHRYRYLSLFLSQVAIYELVVRTMYEAAEEISQDYESPANAQKPRVGSHTLFCT